MQKKQDSAVFLMAVSIHQQTKYNQAVIMLNLFDQP